MVAEAQLDTAFWRGRRVLVTGHTGFKGGWLCQWLSLLGAEVHGIALAPNTTPSFFEATELENTIATHRFVDVRDEIAVRQAITDVSPEVTFHMAAQALVRRSYAAPVETFATNVMGTVNVLEALRATAKKQTIVNVTSDKCYENNETGRPFVEVDAVGGSDPYSASKGCAELVGSAYERAFFSGTGVALASVRAGNVVGGGDWSADRLIPDVMRAWRSGAPIEVRNPEAVRPWQHVLEPLSGYLLLAQNLGQDGRRYATAWNFGPLPDNTVTVRQLLNILEDLTGRASWQMQPGNHPNEAQLLNLDISKAREKIGWEPVLDLKETLQLTMQWYEKESLGFNMAAVTVGQIKSYMSKRAWG